MANRTTNSSYEIVTAALLKYLIAMCFVCRVILEKSLTLSLELWLLLVHVGLETGAERLLATLQWEK